MTAVPATVHFTGSKFYPDLLEAFAVEQYNEELSPAELYRRIEISCQTSCTVTIDSADNSKPVLANAYHALMSFKSLDLSVKVSSDMLKTLVNVAQGEKHCIQSFSTTELRKLVQAAALVNYTHTKELRRELQLLPEPLEDFLEQRFLGKEDDQAFIADMRRRIHSLQRRMPPDRQQLLEGYMAKYINQEPCSATPEHCELLFFIMDRDPSLCLEALFSVEEKSAMQNLFFLFEASQSIVIESILNTSAEDRLPYPLSDPLPEYIFGRHTNLQPTLRNLVEDLSCGDIGASIRLQIVMRCYLAGDLPLTYLLSTAEEFAQIDILCRKAFVASLPRNWSDMGNYPDVHNGYDLVEILLNKPSRTPTKKLLSYLMAQPEPSPLVLLLTNGCPQLKQFAKLLTLCKQEEKLFDSLNEVEEQRQIFLAAMAERLFDDAFLQQHLKKLCATEGLFVLGNIKLENFVDSCKQVLAMFARHSKVAKALGDPQMHRIAYHMHIAFQWLMREDFSECAKSLQHLLRRTKVSLEEEKARQLRCCSLISNEEELKNLAVLKKKQQVYIPYLFHEKPALLIVLRRENDIYMQDLRPNGLSKKGSLLGPIKKKLAALWGYEDGFISYSRQQSCYEIEEKGTFQQHFYKCFVFMMQSISDLNEKHNITELLTAQDEEPTEKVASSPLQTFLHTLAESAFEDDLVLSSSAPFSGSRSFASESEPSFAEYHTTSSRHSPSMSGDNFSLAKQDFSNGKWPLGWPQADLFSSCKVEEAIAILKNDPLSAMSFTNYAIATNWLDNYGILAKIQSPEQLALHRELCESIEKENLDKKTVENMDLLTLHFSLLDNGFYHSRYAAKITG